MSEPHPASRSASASSLPPAWAFSPTSPSPSRPLRPSKQLPPLLPYSLALDIRRASLRAAWYAANTQIGYEEDAETDLRGLKGLCGSIGETCGSELAEPIERLVLSAAWREVHAANEEEARAEAARVEFEASERSIGGLLGEAAPLVGRMAALAATHVARRRFTGEECEEARTSLVGLLRAFHQLSTWRRDKWLGVNLGGWLLLEYGPAAPLFQNQGAEGNGEWALSEELRAHGLEEQLFREHRTRHVTMDELTTIASLGINAIRVPFGYWVVSGPSCGDPYVGPCLEQLDRVVSMGGELGLEVLLDLHGNPGGETDNKCCGRDRPEWTFEEWRREEALEVLTTVARRYSLSAAVTAVQVCNEPSKEIPPRALVDHYVAAAKAVREGGMSADRVAVICPLYYTDETDKNEFYRLWLEAFEGLDNCVLDVHPYYFGEWSNAEIAGPLVRQMADQAHELAAFCPASTVGEWSAAPPPDICELGPSGRPTRREFFELQLRLWHAATTHGSFFWCWSDNSGPDWCLRALVPGRREAISSAAQESSAAWTTNYTRPSIEEIDEEFDENALNSLWTAMERPQNA